MDPTQPQQSLPWAISQQHPSTREQPGGEGTGRRNSFLQQDKWTLKTCQQCQEPFIPSPPNNDVEFCSGDCRFSCSILRHSKKAKNQQKKK